MPLFTELLRNLHRVELVRAPARPGGGVRPRPRPRRMEPRPRVGPAPLHRPGDSWSTDSGPGGEGPAKIVAFISRRALKLGIGGSHWSRGTTGPAPPAVPGPPRGGRTGTPGRAAGAESQAVKPVTAFAASPSAPWGALLPTDPPSEGLWAHPRPLCLPLCPPRLHPRLPTSPSWAQSSSGLWAWVGTCPPGFSSSTFSLRRRGGGERGGGRRELERRGQEETGDPAT